MNKLYEALSKAQINFKTPVKDKKAHYGDYASIGSLNAATNKALSAEGLSVWQPIVTIDNVQYIKTLLTHSSGESIESLMSLPTISPGGNYFHKLGSAISYTRRYALMAILNISADDVEDDGDSLNNIQVEQPKKNTDKITEHQKQVLKDIFDGLTDEYKKHAKSVLKNKYGVELTKDLQIRYYNEYSRFLEACFAKQYVQEGEEHNV
ncbi:MAG: ERF family protein [Sphaerochaetaceae bacterium]|nr:ERF family protein [Sphaerochaetaceae bacterium]